MTFSYGDEKCAAEMLFSYGFIEEHVKYTSELTLDLTVPEDDPLKAAKEFVSETSTVKLYRANQSICWDSSFLWLICINEEDGLDFRVLQKVDGARELRIFWKNADLEDVKLLLEKLRVDPLYEIFQLRAICLLQERLRDQMHQLETKAKASEEYCKEAQIRQSHKLRTLEIELLNDGIRELEDQVSRLLTSLSLQPMTNSGHCLRTRK